jgi:fumarate hydratase class II
VLDEKSEGWNDIIKIGRTHLMDATPIRVGQVFSGYASQIRHSINRLEQAIQALSELPIGGTAVGTGLNTHPEFGRRVSGELAQRTGIPFCEAANHMEAQGAKDAVVEVSGLLKTIAVSLSKIAGDFRLLGSGPRCGLFEYILPEIQPGSSIMPGKVNPVICESVIQAAIRVIGNDSAITYAGFGGVGSILELNVAMPVMADALLESIHLLSSVTQLLVDKVIVGMQINIKRCEEFLEASLMVATALTPVLGYDQASHLAKRAYVEGKSIRQLAVELDLLSVEQLNELLDPVSMTEPCRGLNGMG